jgi:hypothetical protein
MFSNPSNVSDTAFVLSADRVPIDEMASGTAASMLRIRPDLAIE